MHVVRLIGFELLFFGLFCLQMDPAGWFPKFFVNRLNTKLVMITESLQKQAQASSIYVKT